MHNSMIKHKTKNSDILCHLLPCYDRIKRNLKTIIPIKTQGRVTLKGNANKKLI